MLGTRLKITFKQTKILKGTYMNAVKLTLNVLAILAATANMVNVAYADDISSPVVATDPTVDTAPTGVLLIATRPVSSGSITVAVDPTTETGSAIDPTLAIGPVMYSSAAPNTSVALSNNSTVKGVAVSNGAHISGNSSSTSTSNANVNSASLNSNQSPFSVRSISSGSRLNVPATPYVSAAPNLPVTTVNTINNTNLNATILNGNGSAHGVVTANSVSKFQ